MSDITIIHNSYSSYYRQPFGAVKTGEKIVLKLDIYNTDEKVDAKLEVYEPSNHQTIQMHLIQTKENKKVFEVQYETPKQAGLVWYYFNVIIDDKTYYYCNNMSSLGGFGRITFNNPVGYQITVHDPIQVPNWFKKGIMYQIFVDRFYKPNEIDKSHYIKNSTFHHDWEESPHYYRDETGNVISWDFFGGNLKGIINKLDYLKDLGVSILYLNPIFKAQSNHKYDTGNYKEVDSAYGDEEILKELIYKAKDKGINIILDGVFSHTGSDSLYFNKENNYDSVGAYQSKDSPYYPWYRFKEYPNDYECWWGVNTMPNVNELEPTYVDYIIRNKDSVIKHWMKLGIKGWRLDVADELPDEFIKLIKSTMNVIDKENILIGEVWEDASHKSSYNNLREYVYGHELDSVMNYPLKDIMIDYVLGNAEGEQFYSRIMSLYENYPKEIFYSLMNLIGSHDRRRILTILGEAPREEEMNDEQKENFKLDNNHFNLAITRLKLLSCLQFTLPGVPCIYYGDEAGVQGFSDPYNRSTYPWGKENKEILNWYKKLGYLRNKYKSLQLGEWNMIMSNGDKLGFERNYNNEEKLVCLFNRSTFKKYEISLKNLVGIRKLKDILNDKEVNSDKIILEPISCNILLL